uniref:Calmodulin regulated spectrin associated protein 1 n=1 Tax=Panthera tigris altaica TaxID=74533 RepID=A0A8C9KNQ3_PANTA
MGVGGGGGRGQGWRALARSPQRARTVRGGALSPVGIMLTCRSLLGSDNIPEDLRDPFYIDQYEQEHIKPPVIKLLLSSELYCRVCSLILKGDQVAALQGHQSVIQALSRKGIYVMESDDTPVTDPDLSHAPIKMSAHMAMVDALMMAYTVEMISIEKVVASVQRFSTFSASKELPYDLEDAMVFWVNKVNLKMREITEKEVKLKQQLLESPAHQKVRYRREHLSARQPPYFPLLEDLMRDGSDGAALLAVVHYYCPEQMKLDDICLKEVTSMADSLYNIRLLREFSNEYLNKCFYLTLEDMLYAPLVLKPNVMVFIAELFWWFENVKPDFVQPRDVQELKDAKTVSHHKSSRPPVPISNATKRSFLGSPAATDTLVILFSCSFPFRGKGASAFSPSHPLLPLRQRQQKTAQGEGLPDQRHRSNSLTRVDGQPPGAAVAWPVSQPAPFALHHAASCDLDPGSGDSVSLARSISKDSLASSVINLTPQNQPQPAALKTDGKSLLNDVHIEDEELVAVIRTDVVPHGGDRGLPASARSPQRLAVPKDRQASSRSKTPTPSVESLPHLRPCPPRTPSDPGWDGVAEPGGDPPEKYFFDSYRLHDENNQRTLVLSSSKDANILSEQMSLKEVLESGVKEVGLSCPSVSGKENVPVDEPPRGKASLIEVDLSDLKAPDEDGETEGPQSAVDLASEGDQKPGVGFFFKDEQKAEDELAKKRAAFLLKQQRKAEEARVRKQQLEAEVGLKRCRGAGAQSVGWLRRHKVWEVGVRVAGVQSTEMWGVGGTESWTPAPPRPRVAGSLHLGFPCTDGGGAGSHQPVWVGAPGGACDHPCPIALSFGRVESLEALPTLSRNPSRSTDRDWETASAASSLASVAEYTGPKLFKEPSSKSNKPIIHNAISHCCLAGKVNEPHKNSILEELEKCDANHYIILFRDAGCQFRALYCYYPDTEEIYKLTGTGPKSITKKMIDKLYKYSSDRKQFNLIPAKTMSVSVDALTIHNHLWQPKRPAVPKKTQTRK